MRRDFVRASYTGPGTEGQSAARLARYIEDRRQEREHQNELEGERQDGREPDGERYEKAPTFGDRGEFVRAARERAEEGRRSSYVHVVVSPERGNEFSDKDFERLIEPWKHDRQGRECPYFAAVHRDTEHTHLHVAVARDKFQKAEYADLKEQTRERIEGRERFHGEPEKELAREQEERALGRELAQERERDKEPRERDHRREQERDGRETEMER
jgi:hypothetical protein